MTRVELEDASAGAALRQKAKRRNGAFRARQASFRDRRSPFYRSAHLDAVSITRTGIASRGDLAGWAGPVSQCGRRMPVAGRVMAGSAQVATLAALWPARLTVVAVLERLDVLIADHQRRDCFARRKRLRIAQSSTHSS